MQIRCGNCFLKYDRSFGMCPSCGHVEGEAAEAYCLAPGTRLADRYIIGQTLGLGGFGITYKAFDTQLEMVLAVKEYFPSGMVNRSAGDTEVFLVASKRQEEYQIGRERFLDEARHLAKFSKHRNIVNVFNFFEANQTAYIVMEYLDGMTLSQTLRAQNRPLPAEQCAAIAMDVCQALSTIHQEGIIHRDVSPDNIMLCKDGGVKLFDFGAARFSGEKAEDRRVTVIVKPGFAPPEQYDNINKQDARTDLYALGATMYYAVTGTKPMESTDRKVRDTMPPPRARVPSVPVYFNNAIMRVMAVEPRFRFSSAESFRKVLEEKTQVATAVTEKKKQHRRKLWSILGAAAVVAVAAVAVLAVWHYKQEAVKVPDGSIQLWYMTTGDEQKDQSTKAAWRSLVDAFTQEHPNVSVTAVGIPAAEYAQRLEHAEDTDTMPDIYASTQLIPTEAQSLKTLLAEDSQGVYLEALTEEDRYPTGLIVPTIYVRSSIGSLPQTDTIAGMAAACEAGEGRLLTSATAASLYQRAYGEDLMEHISGDALERFLSGECLVYLGTTEDYLQVQQGAVGSYWVLFPDTDTTAYSYGSLWSCSPGDKDTTKICHAMLAYLNSDVGQDYLNIRDHASSGCVPATRSGIEAFVDSYTELSGLVDYLGEP